jgi:hypothetical protein
LIRLGEEDRLVGIERVEALPEGAEALTGVDLDDDATIVEDDDLGDDDREDDGEAKGDSGASDED